MPGQEVGYCTIRDCTLAPDSCPSGYMCIDAGLYSPGEPKICVKTS